MPHAEALRALLLADPVRLRILHCLRALSLPDAWVAAGVLRSAVWDAAHGRVPEASFGDIDVIWFDAARAEHEADAALEAALHAMAPGLAWSVRKQARMHRRNNDAPYASATDAMRFWPETATAIAARLEADDGISIAAPFGLEDLFAWALRPTPAFSGAKRAIMEQRVLDKRWRERWPMLRLASGEGWSGMPASPP